MATRIRSRNVMSLLVAALVSSCGGGGGGDDGTSVAGQIDLPPAEQCTNCRNGGVQVTVFGPLRNAPPAPPVATVQTDASGTFDTGDLSDALEGYPGAPDTNGDGRRTLIAAATVSDTGTIIGGVLSVREGASNEKTYNVMTQVACLAAIYLTAGTAPADPGCVVRANCLDQPPNCLTTIDPDSLDQAGIKRLEDAADFIDGDVELPGEVPAAACAVIACTGGGVRSATRECVEAAFSDSN